MLKNWKCPFIGIAVLVFTVVGHGYNEIIDLGTLPNYPNYPTSIATSINNNGQVVGHAEISDQWEYRACLYDTSGAGNNIYLGGLGSYAGRWGMAGTISDNGLIVGVAADRNGYQHACIFDPTGSGNNKNLGTLGGTQSYAFSVNNNNTIVGWASGKFSLEACFFNATGAGRNKGLGTLGGYESVAADINNNNLVVGWAQNSSRLERACIFDITGNGNNLDLGTLGGNTAAAFRVNDSGLIVGHAQSNAGYQVACLFDSSGAGNNINLGTLGGTGSYALGINNDNQIIGWALTNSGDKRACLFDITGNGANIDLNSLIDPALDWTLTAAYSINDYGWIVGEGINPDGQIHAYLLTPEPAAMLLFALGGLMLRKRKAVN